MRIRSTGFSVIELLVVLAIAGALIAWGYPKLATLAGKYRLDNAAWNLATDLQKVRLRAIAEGTRFEVVFNGTARTYQVRKETSPGTFTNDGAARPVDEADAISLSSTANPIFTTRGILQAGTTSVVTLAGPTGGVRLVAAQLPGRIYVQ